MLETALGFCCLYAVYHRYCAFLGLPYTETNSCFQRSRKDGKDRVPPRLD